MRRAIVPVLFVLFSCVCAAPLIAQTQSTSLGNDTSFAHQPAWSNTPKSEMSAEASEVPISVQQARDERFKNFFLTDIDSPENSIYRSRVYSLPKYVSLLPVASSDLIVVATPINAQPHLAANRSAVYSDLQLATTQVLENKLSLSTSKPLSVLYPGGTVRTEKGTIVKADIGSGTTPLELDHPYLLFLSYSKNTESYNILSAWDLSEPSPKILGRNGRAPRNSAKLPFDSTAALISKVLIDVSALKPNDVHN